MRSVAFVLNDFSEFNFSEWIEKYLEDFDVSILDHFPDTPSKYDLVVLWSYQKIVDVGADNVIIFHSSDLPEGRGWAPIYHSLAENRAYYTICGIKLAEPVDAGDIVVRARFPILAHYTASALRAFDSEISIILTAKVLKRFCDRPMRGRIQSGAGNYYHRRKPEDNELDISLQFESLIPLIRGCEENHPAFFYFEGAKYLIHISPTQSAFFPEDLEIEFFDE